MSENFINGAVVNRHTQQQTLVSGNAYDDLPDGLPFYYTLDIKWCIFLIVIGVIVGIVQVIFMGFLVFLPFLRKEYVCTRCKTKITRLFKPKKCPICGGMILPVKEYLDE